MIIERRNFIDWEPLVITLWPSGANRLDAAALEQRVSQWLSDRAAKPVCQTGCRLKYLDVRPGWKVPSMDLAMQWVCEECLQNLLKVLEDEFPTIEKAEIGGHPSPKRPRERYVLHIEARKVTFEDGRIIFVQPFDIENYPVSIGQFEEFASKTGYVTVAEKLGNRDTYRQNVFLHGLDKLDREDCEAFFISYDDAIAYCDWAKCRLPSEAEILAAALADDEVRTGDPSDEARFAALERIIRAQGTTISATLEGTKVVIRSKPWLFKKQNWIAMLDKHRRLVSHDKPVGQFYTVH